MFLLGWFVSLSLPDTQLRSQNSNITGRNYMYRIKCWNCFRKKHLRKDQLGKKLSKCKLFKLNKLFYRIRCWNRCTLTSQDYTRMCLTKCNNLIQKNSI